MPELSGRQKAAILMVALGPAVASRVFRHLEEQEIEKLTLEIASLKRIPPETRNRVLEEFEELHMAKRAVSQGGLGYARELLERALGAPKAAQIITQLTSSLEARPFDFLRAAPPEQILSVLRAEHPQAIALVLSYLRAEQAAQLLMGLRDELRADVVRRIAVLDRTSPDVVRDIEQLMERRLSGSGMRAKTQAGGVPAAVDILNRLDRSTERSILQGLATTNPDLSEEIKKRMFVFEDIQFLDDHAMQRVLRDVEMNRDMPLALKVASDDLRTRIFANISQRAAQTLQEAIQYLGPVRLKDVEEAQQRIVNAVRRLEEDGEIVIARGGGEEIVV